MIVDARGMGCPKPVLLAEHALSEMGEGIVDVLIDNEASLKNLMRFASKNGHYSEDSREDGYWKVRIVKGYSCEVQSDATAHQEPGKDVLLIIGSDTIGKDETLGKILMKGFFETMKVTKEVPHTIFFLNTAVKLTTTDQEMIAILRDIEKMGVEIFSCGTCLKHYDIEKSLMIGYRGTTNHIVEGINNFKKTVWIG